MATTQQVSGAFKIAIAVAEAIREAKQIPAGTLYAVMMGYLTLEQFEGIIGSLVRAGVVARDGSHLLRWIA